MPPAPRPLDPESMTGRLDAAADEAALRTALQECAVTLMGAPRPPAGAPQLWSSVLRHGVAAGVRLTGGVHAPAVAWFASGSAARGEAVPGSDVETLIICDDDATDDEKSVALARAAETHALLERCGVAGDANGVQAGRLRFCRRRRSWAEGIDRWAAEPQRDRGVVMTGVLLDAVSLSGSADPGLSGRVSEAGRRHYALRQAMLQDATTVRATVPSRLRALTRHADSVDVKLAVIDPVVKIARWGALSAGSPAVSTAERLADAQAAGLLDADDASSLRDCHAWLLGFRWRRRVAARLAQRSPDDTVSLAELSPQDRATLRSVARDVSGTMRKLDYLASTSAFR